MTRGLLGAPLPNTPLKLTAGPGENRIIEREFYGITVQAGVNYKL
jgi:hypothetical protein